MQFIIKLAIADDNGTEQLEEIIHLDKNYDDKNVIGITLNESKQLLKTLQSKII